MRTTPESRAKMIVAEYIGILTHAAAAQEPERHELKQRAANLLDRMTWKSQDKAVAIALDKKLLG